MRPHIGHPLYVYRPWTEARRRQASIAQRRRLGIPDGHVQIYGEHIPEHIAAPVRYWATYLAWKYGRKREANALVRRLKASGYEDLGWLYRQWEAKLEASEIRRIIRAIREVVGYGY